MLNEQQLEILSDVIRPLFQSLERDVIMDIARRIEETMTYTQTAEVMAEHMQQLGYSPNKIRTEVMKLLNADKEYKKAVEENTREYKKEIKKLMNEYTQEAKDLGKDVITNAGNMSWNEDLSLWKSVGKNLSDNSFLHQLQNAIAKQTIEEFVNLTRTTGFKTMSGYESIGNAFRNELDKAAIKICTGTFSQDKVISDVIHNLAKSGLRSIDYASGYSMQLDTAVKNALRTGCAQLSAKVMDENIQRTGENLVYVSKHWGARNKGIGVDNHELWQGKVYFIKPGKDYSEEAKRIGQDRIMDIWYSTGYSPDGSHVNDPLGLHGYYCRHTHRVWFEGISSLPDEQEEPAPVEINGKTYDYYAMTQKQRAMERNIRALKRERVARNDLKLPTTEINKRIKQKIREYEEFCKKYNMPENANAFRMDSKGVDITKTKAYKIYKNSAHSVNTGAKVYFNEAKDYRINMSTYNAEINDSLSKAARELAIKGSSDGYEHGVFVNLKTGEIDKYVTDKLPTSVVPNYSYLDKYPDAEVAFLHNHNTDTELSFPDIGLIMNEKEINVVAAVRNDGIITVVESNGKKTSDYIWSEYSEYRKELETEMFNSKGYINSMEIELQLRNKAIEDYAKGGMQIYGK